MKEMLGGCCVCSDENGWAGNPLVYCDGPECEVAVHQGCYGIIEVPEGEWFCAKCAVPESSEDIKPGTEKKHDGSMPSTSAGGSSQNGRSSLKHPLPHFEKPKIEWNGCIGPRCELCPFGYGALKRTDKGRWAHVICALYIPEVRFGDVHSMQPVILDDVPKERFDRVCYLCEEEGALNAAKVGACMSCNRQGCKKGFHVTCAQQRGLLCEEGGVSKNVKYCGYCDLHLRKASQDPTIKVVPPCRVRPLPTALGTSPRSILTREDVSNQTLSLYSSTLVSRTQQSMLQDPILKRSSERSSLSASSPVSETVAGVAAGTVGGERSMQLQHGREPGPPNGNGAGNVNSFLASSTTFSPPLTSSSISSPVHATTTVKEMLQSNGGSLLHSLAPSTSNSLPAMNGSSLGVSPTFSAPANSAAAAALASANLTASITAVASREYNGVMHLNPSSGLPTNHNRLDTVVPRANGHATPSSAAVAAAAASLAADVSVGAALAASMAAPKANSAKRSHKGLTSDDKPTPASKRARANHHHHVGGGPGRPSASLAASASSTAASFAAAKHHSAANASSSSDRALRESCEQLVSETVSEFQCERADKAAAAQRSRQMAAAAAVVAGAAPDATTGSVVQAAYARANALHNDIKQDLKAAPLVGLASTSTAPVPHRLTGSLPEEVHVPTPSTMPGSMEEFLERQWEQGSQFLMSSSSFDVAQLLTCLHQLKRENIRLEDQLSQLSKRRDVLMALNARLAMPLGSALPHNASAPHNMAAAPHQQSMAQYQSFPGNSGMPPQQHLNGGLLSPTALSVGSPHFGNSNLPGNAISSSNATNLPSMSTQQQQQEDSLTHLRSLAASGRSGTPASRGRGGSSLGVEQPGMVSSSSCSQTPSRLPAPTPTIPTSAQTYHRSNLSSSPLVSTPGISQQQSSVVSSPSFQSHNSQQVPTSAGMDLSGAGGMNDERWTTNTQLIKNAFLRAAQQQPQLMMGDPVLASLALLHQQQQQQNNIMNNQQTAQLIAQMMLQQSGNGGAGTK